MEFCQTRIIQIVKVSIIEKNIYLMENFNISSNNNIIAFVIITGLMPIKQNI